MRYRRHQAAAHLCSVGLLASCNGTDRHRAAWSMSARPPPPTRDLIVMSEATYSPTPKSKAKSASGPAASAFEIPKFEMPSFEIPKMEVPAAFREFAEKGV